MKRSTFSIDIPLPSEQLDPYMIVLLAMLAVSFILLVIVRRAIRRRKLAGTIRDEVESQLQKQVNSEQLRAQANEEELRDIYRSQLSGMIGSILQEYAVQVRKLQEYENRLDAKLADAKFAVSYIDEVERKSRVLDKHLADVWDLRRDIADVRKRVKDCSTLVKKAYADATKSQSIAKKLNSVCSFYDMLDRDGFWKPIEEFEGQRNRR